MGATTYRTAAPGALRVPGRRPALICGDWSGPHCCTRRRGHSGRHARIRYDLGGQVRAVWGERPKREAT